MTPLSQFAYPYKWQTLQYWVDRCWKDAKGNPLEYARLMRIFVRDHNLIK